MKIQARYHIAPTQLQWPRTTSRRLTWRRTDDRFAVRRVVLVSGRHRHVHDHGRQDAELQQTSPWAAPRRRPREAFTLPIRVRCRTCNAERRDVYLENTQRIHLLGFQTRGKGNTQKYVGRCKRRMLCTVSVSAPPPTKSTQSPGKGPTQNSHKSTSACCEILFDG